MFQRDDAQALFQIAQELAAQADSANDVMKWRSAVNRAYYAVFLLAREKTRVTPENDVHAEVVRRVRRQYGDLISRDLFRLKELRRAADYEFPPPEELSDWRANWTSTERKAQFLMDRFR